MKSILIPVVALSALSPSPRRAWIEITMIGLSTALAQSPSPRRAWIEIYDIRLDKIAELVALPTEGVD